MVAPLISNQSDLGKLAAGTVVALSGAILGNGIAYVYGLIIARSLGPEEVGLYFLGLILMQFFSSVCRLGLPDGLLRFVAIHAGRGDWSRVKGTFLCALFVGGSVSFLGGTLTFVFADVVSVHFFKQKDLGPYLRWFAITLPLFSIFILATNALQALRRMDLVVLARDFIQPLSLLVFGLGFFYLLKNSESFVAAYLVSTLIALGAAIFLLRRASASLAQSASPRLDGWRILLAFSLPVAGGDIAHYLSYWCDTFLLSILKSSSEVGIYQAALRTTLLLNLLSVSLNALYAPIIADHYSSGRHQQIQLILKTLVRWCLTVALPLVFAMSLLAEQILSLWGSEFVAGASALVILAVSQLIFVTSGLLAFTLLMCGKQYLELGNTVFVAVLNVIVNLLLIPPYGITGAALSVLFSQIIIFCMRLLELRHVLDINLYSPRYIKPLAALLPVSLTGTLLQVPIARMMHTVFGSEAAVIIGISLLIAANYIIVLYMLGVEKEDVSVWKELRIHRTSLTG